MEEVVHQAAGSMLDYVFGAFCLLLLALICAMLWFWLKDKNKQTEDHTKLATSMIQVLSDNAVAKSALSKSIDESTGVQKKLHEHLLTRPCLRNGPQTE